MTQDIRQTAAIFLPTPNLCQPLSKKLKNWRTLILNSPKPLLLKPGARFSLNWKVEYCSIFFSRNAKNQPRPSFFPWRPHIFITVPWRVVFRHGLSSGDHDMSFSAMNWHRQLNQPADSFCLIPCALSLGPGFYLYIYGRPSFFVRSRSNRQSSLQGGEKKESPEKININW
jgi:hypothetical protein